MTAATGPSDPSASHDSADAFEDASRPSPTPEASGPLPQASSSRDAWAREAARIRRKVTEEARTVASDVQRESIERGERLSRAARERVDAALAEAGGLLGTDASAETLALLARERVDGLVRASQEDVSRWQAEVVSSVESRVLDEFDALAKELEPSLRESGRRASREAMGFMGRKWTPTKFVAEEARRAGDEEHLARLDRFERRFVQPVLVPFKRGLMEPVLEKAPFLVAGLVTYSVGCGMLGAWIGGKMRNRGGGGSRGGSGSEGSR
jgi:hypothetical protein